MLERFVQSREEGVALAVQLAECKERTRRAENSADDAHDELRGLREQLEEAESQVQQMQQKLVNTAASCRRYERTVFYCRLHTHCTHACQAVASNFELVYIVCCKLWQVNVALIWSQPPNMCCVESVMP